MEKQQPKRSAGLERLMKAVSEVPLRYAPFFDQLAELWNIDEAAVIELLTRSRDARAWRRGPLPGARWMAVRGGASTAGDGLFLARFPPGMRFPRHRHAGSETVLVLEGGYTDSDGRTVGPGDLQVMTAGSHHALTVDDDGSCVVAVRQSGIEFTHPILRRVARLLGM